jgi:uracil phosphoribosyltransferase
MATLPTAFANLRVLDHAVLRVRITRLRDRTTPMREFRLLVRDIGVYLTIEATSTLRTVEVSVRTPLESTTGHAFPRPPTIVPILRAGLGLSDGALAVLPEARVGHLGLRRNEKTFEPISYYAKLPPGAEEGPVIVVDPMLATGGTGVAAFDQLKARGCRDLRFLVAVACPEGVRRMLERHPDVPILAAVLDRELGKDGFIHPGIGDAGDRIFGTLSLEEAEGRV